MSTQGIQLDGKVVLVTGAAQGIGRAIALRAAQAGAYAVVVTDRQEVIASTARAIEEAGCRAMFVQAELENTCSPKTIVGKCVDKFQRVDCLVNAAALSDRGSIVDASPELWAKLNRVNAEAPFFLMQKAILDMLDRGTGGSIVNILSMNSYCGLPELSVYSATKGALATITKNAAHALRSHQIRVNGINVGWVDTPSERYLQEEVLGKGRGYLKTAAGEQPFGRLFSCEDVAELTVFFLSDACGPVTGSIVDQEQWVAGASSTKYS